MNHFPKFVLIFSAAALALHRGIPQSDGAGAASRPDSAPASRPASEEGSRPASLPVVPSDPEAVAFLQNAAAKRSPKGEPAILDLTVEFEAEANTDVHNEIEGKHQYLRQESLNRGRIRTQITNNSVKTEQGFDGSNYWIRRGDRVQSLAGREFEKDRRQIDDAIRQTDQMIQLNSLLTLSKRMAELKIIKPQTAAGNVQITGKVRNFPTFVSGEIPLANLTLQFHPGSHDLVAARGEAADGSGIVENMEFGDTREVSGTRFPFFVKAWTKTPSTPEFMLQIKKLTLNSGLEPAHFSAEINKK